MHTAKDFTPGRRVRNLKTGELGTLVPSTPAEIKQHDLVVVMYDGDEREGGWSTPMYKLELLPAPAYDTFPEGEG